MVDKDIKAGKYDDLKEAIKEDNKVKGGLNTSVSNMEQNKVKCNLDDTLLNIRY